jgi:excisionase family DNA binding protein
MEVVIVGEVPDFFTVEEAARILRISRSTAYRLVRLYLETGGREGLPVVVVGGLYRVPRLALEQLAGGPVHLPEVAEVPPVVERGEWRPVEAARRRPRKHARAAGPASSSDQLRFPLN